MKKISIELNGIVITDSERTICRVEEMFTCTKRISLKKGISFRDYSKIVYVERLNLEDEKNFEDALNSTSDEILLGFADLDTNESYYDFLVECREEAIANREHRDEKINFYPALLKIAVTVMLLIFIPTVSTEAFYPVVNTKKEKKVTISLLNEKEIQQMAKIKQIIEVKEELSKIRVTNREIGAYFNKTPTTVSKNEFKEALRESLKLKVFFGELAFKIRYKEWGDTAKKRNLPLENGTYLRVDARTGTKELVKYEDLKLSENDKKILRKAGVLWVES